MVKRNSSEGLKGSTSFYCGFVLSFVIFCYFVTSYTSIRILPPQWVYPTCRSKRGIVHQIQTCRPVKPSFRVVYRDKIPDDDKCARHQVEENGREGIEDDCVTGSANPTIQTLQKVSFLHIMMQSICKITHWQSYADSATTTRSKRIIKRVFWCSFMHTPIILFKKMA